MPTITATTKTARARELTNEQLHHKGLAAVLAAMQEKNPYDAVLQLDANPAVDPALRDAALRVANTRASTTVTLEMSERDACSVLGCLCLHFDDLFGGLALGELPCEDDLSKVGDYGHAIDAMATALQTPSARMARTQRDHGVQLPQTIKPAIVSRLEALRNEFTDDPDAIEFLIDMAGLFGERAKAAAASPATGDTSDQ